MIEWEDVAREFEFTGSWRDIYVFGTTMSDWQAALDALRRSSMQLSYFRGGQATALPARVQDAFPDQGQADRLLRAQVAGVTLNCHFFSDTEIEFDMDPREVHGQEQLDALTTFMQLVADACGKPAVLTEENLREALILRTTPDSGMVEYHSPTRGWQAG